MTGPRPPVSPPVLLWRSFAEVLPLSSRELAGWHERAEAIPDPELRRQALASLRLKRFHADGGAVYATGAPRGPERERLVRLIVAFQTAYDRQGMFSAPKHFPGLGTASQPTEEGPAQVGLSDVELEDRDLVPFRAAFRAGAPGVVLSHALYTVDDFTIPGSLSRKIVTGLLRDKLKFRGVAITDDLADPAITALESVPDAAVKAIQAGADMLWISGSAGDQQAAYVAVLQAVRRKRISRARLDVAVGRVLTAKRRYGLIR